MIQTNRLILRPWQESDLFILQQLRNNVSLQALLLSKVRGSSLSSVHKWVEEKSNGTDRLFFVVEHLGSQQPIGYIQLQEEPNATRTFRFGICLTPTYQSQGYGSEAILAVEHFLKLNFYIYKMILHVDSQNSSAIACYKKLAYREVGVMYCHVFIQGSLRDVVIMEKLLSSQLG